MGGTQKRTFDVAIVGGGLVGNSLACALSQTFLRVVLVEAVPFKSDAQPSYSERMIALSQGSKRILSTLGVWPEVIARDATPIKSIHISDRGHSGFTRLRNSDAGVAALGYVVPARVLGQALLASLAKTEVTTICPGEVTNIAIEEDGAIMAVQTDDGEITVGSRTLVVAEGGRSQARDWLGIRAVRRDYAQTAVVTTVTSDRDHENRAYERFTASGPLALLPTSNKRYAVVWTVESDQAPALMVQPDADFVAALQKRFGDRAGKFADPGKRTAYPLSLIRVPNPVAHRSVAIGNAAHVTHPVAGQGFNLGLRDVAVLAEVLHQAARDGRDVGSESVLKSYARLRRRDTERTLAFTDGLIRLFANDHLPLAFVRGIGLIAVDVFPFFKRMLLRQTMGLAGRVPQLGRGIPLE